MTMGDAICEEEEEKKKKQKLDHHPVPDHGGDADTTEDTGGCSIDMDTEPIPSDDPLDSPVSSPSLPLPCPPSSYLESLYFPYASDDDPEASDKFFDLLAKKGPYVDDLKNEDVEKIYSLYCKAGPKTRSKLWEQRGKALENKIEQLSREIHIEAQEAYPHTVKFWSDPEDRFPERKEDFLFAQLRYFQPLMDPYPYIYILRCPFTAGHLDPSPKYEVKSLCKKSDQQFVRLQQELEEKCFAAGKVGSSYLYSEADLFEEARKIALSHKLTLLTPEDVSEAMQACVELRHQKELCDEARQLLNECLTMKQACGSYDEAKADAIIDAYGIPRVLVEIILSRAEEAPNAVEYFDSFHKRAWEEVKEELPKRAWYLKQKLRFTELLGL